MASHLPNNNSSSTSSNTNTTTPSNNPTNPTLKSQQLSNPNLSSQVSVNTSGYLQPHLSNLSQLTSQHPMNLTGYPMQMQMASNPNTHPSTVEEYVNANQSSFETSISTKS
jgi:hypothetical protein